MRPGWNPPAIAAIVAVALLLIGHWIGAHSDSGRTGLWRWLRNHTIQALRRKPPLQVRTPQGHPDRQFTLTEQDMTILMEIEKHYTRRAAREHVYRERP
jgi:hypothetical protein